MFWAARLNAEGWLANAEKPPPVVFVGVVLLPPPLKAPVDPVLLKALNAPEAGLINDDAVDWPKAEGCPKTEVVAGGCRG